MVTIGLNGSTTSSNCPIFTLQFRNLLKVFAIAGEEYSTMVNCDRSNLQIVLPQTTIPYAPIPLNYATLVHSGQHLQRADYPCSYP
jgi:hypothetical protein